MIFLRQHALPDGLILDEPELILLDEEEEEEGAGDDDADDSDVPEQGEGELLGVVDSEAQRVLVGQVEHVVCINYGEGKYTE